MLKVLLVDDEPFIIQGLKVLIDWEQEGYMIAGTASNGKEAYDFLKKESLQNIPSDIDIAYYLIHSMSTQTGDFESMEQICATNFRQRMQETKVQQVIYLSGIVNDANLSKHLLSRKNVEAILHNQVPKKQKTREPEL